MRLGREQFRKRQIMSQKDFLEDFFVGIAQIKNAEFALHVGHVLDDFVRLLLANRKIVLRRVEFMDELDKCVDGKRIMLTRNGEMRFRVFEPLERILELIGLVDDLARIA